MYLTWGGGIQTSNLGREANLSFCLGECPMFQKYWWWAQSNGSFWGKKQKTNKTVHPSLINRSITI